MRVLVVLNAEPGVGRRSTTAVGLAGALVRNEDTTVRLFIVGDDAKAAGARPPVDDGCGLARLVEGLVNAGVEIRVAGSVPDTHGGTGTLDQVLGVEPSTIRGLSEWTLEADRVLIF